MIRARYRATNTTVQAYSAGNAFIGLLDLFPNAAAAYSLRKLRAAYSGSAVRVRRSSDNTEQDIGFTAQGELDTASLLSFVNSGEVFTNPDITSATGWTIGSNTTYNAVTEAFDLNNENGLTVRQSKSVSGRTYAITIVLDSVTIGGIKIYAGGAQSAVISTAGTHTLNIVAGSSNNFLGINPDGIVTCTISSFSAIDTTADGLVSTWYDQSLSNDATQSTAANQPKIVSSGAVITEGTSAKPAVDFTDNSHYMQSGTLSGFGNIYTVAMANNFTDAFYAYGLKTTSQHNSLRNNGSTTFLRGTSDISFSQSLPTGQALWFVVQDTTSSVHIDGVLEVSGSNGSSSVDKITLSGRDGGIDGGNVMQEFILFDSNQSSNRTGIETNINTFYSIYP